METPREVKNKSIFLKDAKISRFFTHKICLRHLDNNILSGGAETEVILHPRIISRRIRCRDVMPLRCFGGEACKWSYVSMCHF